MPEHGSLKTYALTCLAVNQITTRFRIKPTNPAMRRRRTGDAEMEIFLARAARLALPKQDLTEPM
jgi:hypothetical protein